MTPPVSETCCRFGERQELAGVLTSPAGAPPRAAVVLVTAGVTPKFGPFRLYAQLARRLAAEGLTVLRFDLGGIGDSGQAVEGPLKERTARELRAAVDFLTARFGLDRVILSGLCSGAVDSFRYAESDPRVTGLALIDPFGYRTAGWHARDLLVRAARRGLWLAGLLPTYGAAAVGLIDYEGMDREEAEKTLRALLARRVPVQFLYTGGMRETFNHRGQLKAMFPRVDFSGLVKLDYFPQLRHTQVLEADRRAIIEAVARRLPFLAATGRGA